MNKRIGLIIALVAGLAVAVGSILIINNFEVLSNWNVNSVAVLKQYLKVFGFLCIMALVYLRLRNTKRSVRNEDEE